MAKTHARCTRCHNLFPVIEMKGAPSIRRNGAPSYMCRHCSAENERYHTSNNEVQGVVKVNGVNVGIEFETAYTDDEGRNVMFEYGFIPTHDSSLCSEGEGARYGYYDENTCEYVSGIMQGLNRASKFALTVDRLISEGHMVLNHSCGTHFHVSINSMKTASGQQVYMDYIRRFYNSLFVPLCEELKADPETTARVFGRYFSDHYAMPITMYSTQEYHGDRYYFINCLADTNIEFRLNKFVYGKQFQNLMKMEVEMVQKIVKYFCEHFNDEGEGRGAKQTAYRTKLAQETAKKLVKTYRKFAANI